jgi:hypothetical protein
MARTYEVTVYNFSELSESAKARAIEQEQEAQRELFDGETTYDDFVTIGEMLGITFKECEITFRNGKTKTKPCIYYTGFACQGDGACFEGRYAYKKGAHKAIRKYAPLDKDLHFIADELLALQKAHGYGLTATMRQEGHYYHSGCMSVEVEHETWQGDTLPEDEVQDQLRNLANWLYKQLEKEYDYQTSEKACRESLEESDYEYDEDGNIQAQ